jgi:predicted nucleic-acid-binding protein
MNITVDTNVLVRAAVLDDLNQDKIVVPTVVLCEFTWVLRSVYKFSSKQIVATIRSLIENRNVEINNLSVTSGLANLEAGGDFADGVIAQEGKWLGGDTFVSFDKAAVVSLTNASHKAKLL